jgi:hypothetical protein
MLENGAEFENDHISMEKLILEKWSNMWNAAISTIMRKWKWLFVNRWKRDPDHYQARICNHVPRRDKCISVFQDYVQNNGPSVTILNFYHLGNLTLFNIFTKPRRLWSYILQLCRISYKPTTSLRILSIYLNKLCVWLSSYNREQRKYCTKQTGAQPACEKWKVNWLSYWNGDGPCCQPSIPTLRKKRKKKDITLKHTHAFR